MATFPIAETFANYAAPAINFGRGILGFQDPVGTSSMQQDLIERATTKGGESGSLGYEDFGLETATPGGRFTGGLFDLLPNPAAFGNVGSTGRVTYKQNPNAPGGYTFGDTKYDFTLDPSDTGIGANILNFINRGGIRESLKYNYDPEKGTVAFDPNNPQVHRTGMLDFNPWKYAASKGFQYLQKKRQEKKKFQKQLEEFRKKEQKEKAAQAAQGPQGGGTWVGGAPAYTYQGQGGGEYRDTLGNIDYHDPYDPGGGEAEGGLIRKKYSAGGIVDLYRYGGF